MTESLKTGFDIFPIKSPTSCMLKWSWSTINLENGNSSSCHRSNYHDIDPDNFEEFHNLPGKIAEREAMIRGEWPQGRCSYCQRIEDHGGISDRIMSMMRRHSIDKIPPELLENPTATKVTPTILEVYFNNTCNLSCGYCTPSVSSKLNDEVRKFGDIKIPGFGKKMFVKDHEKFSDMSGSLWKYLTDQDRYKHIRHFHILGGEPFIQKELDQSTDFWQDHPNPSLTINIITNLMIDHDKFREKISRFVDIVKTNKIYQLEITASIDSWGVEQEYVRYGIDLDLWEKNFKYLLNKQGIHVAVHSCLSLLSVKSTPSLFKKINEWNHIKSDCPIDYSFDVVLGHPHLTPMIGGGDLLRQDFIDILDLMPTSNENQITSKKQMQSVADLVMSKEKNTESLMFLKEYLNELDRRRKTDWTKVFPWLIDV
jgi:organic radical activating enzyme